MLARVCQHATRTYARARVPALALLFRRMRSSSEQTAITSEGRKNTSLICRVNSFYSLSLSLTFSRLFSFLSSTQDPNSSVRKSAFGFSRSIAWCVARTRPFSRVSEQRCKTLHSISQLDASYALLSTRVPTLHETPRTYLTQDLNEIVRCTRTECGERRVRADLVRFVTKKLKGTKAE